MNKRKQKQREDFLADIRAVEAKHGLRLVVMQPAPELRVEEIPGEETKVE